jgi:hypothetical protein
MRTHVARLALALALVALLAAPGTALAQGAADVDSGQAPKVTGSLATPNGVLQGEVTLDPLGEETDESHCLDAPGHKSGDLC